MVVSTHIKKGILLFACLLCAGWAVAQPSLTSDKLLADLQSGDLQASPEETWELAQKALQQAQAGQDLLTEVDVHLALAALPWFAPDYETIESYLAKIQDLRIRPVPLEEIAPLLHHELGYICYFQGNKEQALVHFEHAKRMAAIDQDHALHYQALVGCATVHNNLGHTSLALACLQQALTLVNPQDDPEAALDILTQLATIYVAVGELDSAHRHFETLLNLRRQDGDLRILASELHHAGNLWLQQGVLDRAQSYLFEALDLTTNLGDSLLQVALLTDIAAVFKAQQDWHKTLHYAQQGAKMAQRYHLTHLAALNYKRCGQAWEQLDDPSAALQTYQVAVGLYENQLQDPAELAKLHMLIAALLEAETDYAAAAQNLEEALIQKVSIGDKLSMMDLHLSLADLYLHQGQSGDILRHLSAAQALSRQLKSLTGQERTLQLQAQVFAKEARYEEAYQAQLAYHQLRDSLYALEKTHIVHELEARYQTAQKDRRNAELAADLSQQQLLTEQNKRIIGEKNRQVSLLIVSVAALALGLFFYRYRHRKRRQLLQAQVETMEKTRETETLRAVISGEEQERERIARELHDGLGSQLASIKMLVQAIQNDIPAVVESPIHQRVEHLLDQACQEVRETSHNLMPGALARYGLEQGIRDLCVDLEQSHALQIDCLIHLEGQVDSPTAVSVYRIIQELLRNVVKHAQATEVIVQVETEGACLHLTVEDNGIGFMLHQDQPAGIGLKNVRSRVELLRGTMDLDSHPQEGTSIYLTIPWQQDAPSSFQHS